LGEISEALDDYTRVILFDESTVWAREANRRKLMLGEIYDEVDEEIEQSRTQAVEFEDEDLLEIVEHYAALKSEGAPSAEILEEAAESKVEEKSGRVFIQTTPVSALIYVGEDPAGWSPVLLEKVPLGQLMVAAETDTMSGTGEITVSETDLKRIIIELRQKPGSLRIICDERDVSVYLDDQPMGAVGSGYFADITPGNYQLLLIGESDPHLGLYFSREINIEPNRTARAEAQLIPYGTVDYTIPDGAEAAISGPDYQTRVQKAGRLDFIPVGHYRVDVQSEDYLPHSETLELLQNEIVYLKPALRLVEEHSKELRLALSGKLDSLIRDLSSRDRIRDEDIQASQSLLEEIEAADYDFPILRNRAESLTADLYRRRENQEIDDNILELSDTKKALEEELSSEHNRQRIFKIASWISLGVGVGSLSGMGYSLYMGNQSYNDYLDAQTSEEAIALREETVRYQTLTFVTGAVGIAGVTAFTLLQLLMPRPTQLERDLRDIDNRIERLEQSKK
jgi:hypothetical protein